MERVWRFYGSWYWRKLALLLLEAVGNCLGECHRRRVECLLSACRCRGESCGVHGWVDSGESRKQVSVGTSPFGAKVDITCFCKGAYSKYFRLCNPQMVSVTYSFFLKQPFKNVKTILNWQAVGWIGSVCQLLSSL